MRFMSWHGFCQQSGIRRRTKFKIEMPDGVTHRDTIAHEGTMLSLETELSEEAEIEPLEMTDSSLTSTTDSGLSMRRTVGTLQLVIIVFYSVSGEWGRSQCTCGAR